MRTARGFGRVYLAFRNGAIVCGGIGESGAEKYEFGHDSRRVGLNGNFQFWTDCEFGAGFGAGELFVVYGGDEPVSPAEEIQLWSGGGKYRRIF